MNLLGVNCLYRRALCWLSLFVLKTIKGCTLHANKIPVTLASVKADAAFHSNRCCSASYGWWDWVDLVNEWKKWVIGYTIASSSLMLGALSWRRCHARCIRDDVTPQASCNYYCKHGQLHRFRICIPHCDAYVGSYKLAQTHSTYLEIYTALK